MTSNLAVLRRIKESPWLFTHGAYDMHHVKTLMDEGYLKRNTRDLNYGRVPYSAFELTEKGELILMWEKL